MAAMNATISTPTLAQCSLPPEGAAPNLGRPGVGRAIHIFKPGRHTTMAGETIEFTEADLAASAQAYAPKLHEAPLVLGHPKTDDPAQGWVASLAANARGLFALPRDLEPAFAESVKARRYGKISAKFYRPDSPNNPVPGVWYVRHVGFLGAQPPAVKGLDDPAFAQGDGDADCVAFQESVEFGDWNDRNVARLFRSMRDWILAKFGQDEAERALPGWDVTAAQEEAARPDADPTPISVLPTAFSEETRVTPEQKAALEAENKKLKEQLAERDARDRAALDAKRHADNAEFAEGLIAAAKLAPKHKGVLIAVLDQVGTPNADGQDVEFGEGDARQPLAKALRTLCEDLKPVVEFGEAATKGRTAPQSQINPLVQDAEARAANHKE